MKNARKFACNALFGACNVNATKMCYNYVSMHEEKIHIGCTAPKTAVKCNAN